MRKLSLLLVLLLSAGAALAAAESAEFAAANQLFAEGDYGGARSAYESMVRQGVQDPSLYLNLGHTEFRLGREVQAAINYKRALALDPGNTAARSSLEHVLGRLGVPAPGLGFAEIVGRHVSFDLLALGGSLGFWAGLLLVTYAVFSARRRTGLVFLGVLIAMAGVTAVTVSWAGDSRIALAQTAIVAADATDARSTPADNGQKLSVLPVGTPVRVIAERDDWSLVRLPLGVDGWVRTASLERVFPASSPRP
jgi:tetratricopeptide (TPR) repeat protein